MNMRPDLGTTTSAPVAVAVAPMHPVITNFYAKNAVFREASERANLAEIEYDRLSAATEGPCGEVLDAVEALKAFVPCTPADRVEHLKALAVMEDYYGAI